MSKTFSFMDLMDRLISASVLCRALLPSSRLISAAVPTYSSSALGAQFVSFDKLVEVSDIVVLACPLTPETKDLFNRAVFKRMKKSAILVSVSRAGCINHEALVDALTTNKIWGAGLDEFDQENIPELLTLKNCVLFPHVGSATEETRSSMAALSAKNLLNALQGKPMLRPVVI